MTFTDLTAAEREYQQGAHTSEFCPDGGYRIRDLADAAIAALRDERNKEAFFAEEWMARALKAEAEVERLRCCGSEALAAERAYTREMLDPSGSPESRAAAADKKNEALSRWAAREEDGDDG